MIIVILLTIVNFNVNGQHLSDSNGVGIKSFMVSQALNTNLELHPMLISKIGTQTLQAHHRVGDNKTGRFFLALAFLFLLAIVKQLFPKYVNNLFAVFTEFTVSKRQMKEQLENDTRASLGFYMLYVISLGFVIYTAIVAYTNLEFQFSKLYLFLGSLGGIFLILLFKTGITQLLSWIFEKQEIVQQYLFNNTIVNEFAGMILFPICILLLIASPKIGTFLLLMSLGILIILLIYKYIRNFRTINNLLRLDFVHFLLYLCAFEILPLLVLFKLIKGT